jgi:hypothetical protein
MAVSEVSCRHAARDTADMLQETLQTCCKRHVVARGRLYSRRCMSKELGPSTVTAASRRVKYLWNRLPQTKVSARQHIQKTPKCPPFSRVFWWTTEAPLYKWIDWLIDWLIDRLKHPYCMRTHLTDVIRTQCLRDFVFCCKCLSIVWYNYPLWSLRNHLAYDVYPSDVDKWMKPWN